jgi:hypothetical protein
MRKSAFYLAFPLLAFAVAACGGGSPSAAAPTPGPTCGTSAQQVQLVYPAPSATGVSDNLPEVVVAVNPALEAGLWNLAFAQNNVLVGQTGYYFNQISASQLPAGSAPTTITNPTYELVPLSSNLGAKQTYQTALNIPLSNCTALVIPGGTFTTQ